MTLENGGIDSADDLNTATDDANGQDVDGNGNTNEIDELKAQIEILKKEKSGQDKKLAKLLSEKEANELSSKTKEEQLEIYKAKSALYERKEAYRQSLKEVGLNPEEFIAIADEKDPALQASKFAEIIKQSTEKAVNDALEKFKAEELKKVGQPPKPSISGTIPVTNSDKNDFLRQGIEVQ